MNIQDKRVRPQRKSNWPVALGITAAIAGAIVQVAHMGGGETLETTVDTTLIRPESVLVTEQPMRNEYLVMSGDTAYNICQDYGITFGELKEYNPVVEDWNKLEVGQRLYLGDTE